MRLLQNSTLNYCTLRTNDIGLVVAGITLAQHILILVMKCRKCDYAGNVTCPVYVESCVSLPVYFISFTCFRKRDTFLYAIDPSSLC